MTLPPENAPVTSSYGVRERIDSKLWGFDSVPNGDPLPFTPRGLSRELAAFYIGLSPERFDGLVAAGAMPSPRAIDAHEVWDRYELDAAFDLLPRSDRAAPEQPASVEMPRVFTPKTLAAFWGCSEAHVRKLIRSGELRGKLMSQGCFGSYNKF